MTQFTILAGGRTDRPHAPDISAGDRPEVFTLPDHIIRQLSKEVEESQAQLDNLGADDKVGRWDEDVDDRLEVFTLP